MIWGIISATAAKRFFACMWYARIAVTAAPLWTRWQARPGITPRSRALRVPSVVGQRHARRHGEVV